MADPGSETGLGEEEDVEDKVMEEISIWAALATLARRGGAVEALLADF